jgi:hypothetical protein
MIQILFDISIVILHLGQGSFTRKVRTIFTLKIIVSIFVKFFLILVLHLRQFFVMKQEISKGRNYFWFKYDKTDDSYQPQ